MFLTEKHWVCSQASWVNKHFPGYICSAYSACSSLAPRISLGGESKEGKDYREVHFCPEAKPDCKEMTSQTVATIRQIHLRCRKSFVPCSQGEMQIALWFSPVCLSHSCASLLLGWSLQALFSILMTMHLNFVPMFGVWFLSPQRDIWGCEPAHQWLSVLAHGRVIGNYKTQGPP